MRFTRGKTPAPRWGVQAFKRSSVQAFKCSSAQVLAYLSVEALGERVIGWHARVCVGVVTRRLRHDYSNANF